MQSFCLNEIPMINKYLTIPAHRKQKSDEAEHFIA